MYSLKNSDLLTIRPTNGNEGVFARRKILKGETIIQFSGKLFRNEEIPPLKNPEDDRYIQIGPNQYLGPSGDFDDYFNHSCDPNAGVSFRREGEFLMAIRDIAQGEEITWDYSTTMDEDDWEMDCACGSAICRKRVRDFKYLPDELKKKYAAFGIVPDYNLRYLEK